MTTAHTYGEVVRGGRQCCPYQHDSDIKNANQACPYFCHENGRESAYRYTEYNPLDTSQAYLYMTYRNVRASAGHYYQYDVD